MICRTCKHCKHCTLNFHVKCVNYASDIEQYTNWYCKNCFVRICDDELPFSDRFIDLQCKIQKRLKIAHLDIQGSY